MESCDLVAISGIPLLRSKETPPHISRYITSLIGDIALLQLESAPPCIARYTTLAIRGVAFSYPENEYFSFGWVSSLIRMLNEDSKNRLIF